MNPALNQLEQRAQAHGFSGVVRVQRRGDVVVEFACGHRDRANERANTLETRFAVASGTKALTALAVMSLIESGAFALDTTLRSLVPDDLGFIDEAVTIDHLLTHRSGVGEYLNEAAGGDIDAHILGSLSAHTLETARDYLPLLSVHEQQSMPGERFAYNNSGFVMLSLVIEATTGSFHQAVRDRVLVRAAMPDAGFFRSDDLPANTALGYLANGRSNVFHLPVIGMGDGGVFLTLDDTTAFWDALLSGRIVSHESVAAMTAEISVYNDTRSYGRGFWLGPDADHVWLEGRDAGVSFQSGVFRAADVRYSVLSNTSTGAWPLVKAIREALT
ncbi:MAG: CubicO group peptidase (beta-lactamase class C family) [Kiritimatiellia bacterium]|jgi:CubicO group peptidase (beta-lactamase class C family)